MPNDITTYINKERHSEPNAARTKEITPELQNGRNHEMTKLRTTENIQHEITTERNKERTNERTH